MGVVLDAYLANEIDDLQPKQPLEAKLAKIKAFRGTTPTKQMLDYIQQQEQRYEHLKATVKQQLDADVEAISVMKSSTKKAAVVKNEGITECAHKQAQGRDSSLGGG